MSDFPDWGTCECGRDNRYLFHLAPCPGCELYSDGGRLPPKDRATKRAFLERASIAAMAASISTGVVFASTKHRAEACLSFATALWDALEAQEKKP